MAGLSFEDTEKALKMYFSNLLGDDIPKPKHRDGRIVEFTPKGRRRLEGVTPDMVLSALTMLRSTDEFQYELILDRYKFHHSIEKICELRAKGGEDIIQALGHALVNIADLIIDADRRDEVRDGTL